MKKMTKRVNMKKMQEQKRNDESIRKKEAAQKFIKDANQIRENYSSSS